MPMNMNLEGAGVAKRVKDNSEISSCYNSLDSCLVLITLSILEF